MINFKGKVKRHLIMVGLSLFLIAMAIFFTGCFSSLPPNDNDGHLFIIKVEYSNISNYNSYSIDNDIFRLNSLDAKKKLYIDIPNSSEYIQDRFFPEGYYTNWGMDYNREGTRYNFYDFTLNTNIAKNTITFFPFKFVITQYNYGSAPAGTTMQIVWGKEWGVTIIPKPLTQDEITDYINKTFVSDANFYSWDKIMLGDKIIVDDIASEFHPSDSNENQ